MHKVSFSESIDLPRLEHCRPHILSKVLSHPYKQEVRLDWATIGDNISYEMALHNPSLLVAETDKMVSSGEFTFTFIHRVLEHPTFDGLTSDRRTIQLTA